MISSTPRWISFKLIVTDNPGSRRLNTGLKGYFILVVGLFVVAIVIFAVGLLGQQSWAAQKRLTQQFELCIERAPFQKSAQRNQAEQLDPDELQKHFDEFDQIFRETGLPPIWNGRQLVPWRIYHQESIAIAQACHEALGITQPQKQLRGTYAKPVWDPHSEIWMSQ